MWLHQRRSAVLSPRGPKRCWAVHQLGFPEHLHCVITLHVPRAQTGVNPRPGVVGEAILHAGDVGFAPRGVPHHFKNAGCTDAFVLLVFDAGVFNTLDVTHVTANLPAQVWPAPHLNPKTLNSKIVPPAAAVALLI